MSVFSNPALRCAALTLLSACASFDGNEAAWLHEAQGQATQEEVRRHWGAPVSGRSLTSGESLWIYEKREQQAGNRYTAPGTWCEQYTLTFDRRGVLSRWTRRSHFHGGELMPQECIPGTAIQQPS